MGRNLFEAEITGRIVYTRWDSPVGAMLVGSFGDRLCLCDWELEHRRATIDRRICRVLGARYEEGISPVIQEAIHQMQQYFAGTRREFDVPVRFAGTDFQCRVWAELMQIPYGVTVSYAELACRIGRPKSVRAVANANATNPISIFVPCHRVIGSNHSLTGYGGGLAAKESLLALERGEKFLF